MDVVTLIFYASAFGFSSLLSICIFIIATSSNHPKIVRSKKEKQFLNPKDGQLYPFPNLTEKYSVDLSIIIPAYNEEVRLRPMLDECTQFLEDRSKQNNFKYEIILVSDGSQDGTVKVGNEYCKQLGTEKFRILDLESNRGKGGAVRLGMLSARGSKLLFADADGATKFSDLTKLENALEELLKSKGGDIADELGISIGSRAHLEDEAVATRSIFRTILMFGFHALVWLFAVRGVRDTQCGFKLLTRRAAFICFNSLHVERWAFDVELLYIAQSLKIPIVEVAVNWTEIDGSKITPVWSWLQMGRDLFLIWLRYTIGAWKIRPQKTE